MLLFIFTEVMLFSGLISAFKIVKAAAPGGVWPPPGQPRLPVEATAFNTFALVASGVVMYFAARAYYQKREELSRKLLAVAMGLGLFFVLFQGVEWVEMLSMGLTMTSSTHGSFFYLVVGFHGVHAVLAVVVLGWLYLRMREGEVKKSQMQTTAIFWYFVVGLWPVLYWQVYL